MKIIKLRTTESTSSFLKDLVKNTPQENFTVIITDEQTLGRGQMQQSWLSEPFKNLTFSVFVSFEVLPITHQKYLNFAVSLAVFEVLQEEILPKLTIKWPNDILSASQKLCGILIENQLQQATIKSSIVGIGLNVNQIEFNNLPNATSLKKITNTDYDLEDLLIKIIQNLKEKIALLSAENYTVLETEYLKNLYKYQKPAMFKGAGENLFMGKIVGVSLEGKLQIELEDETVSEFGIKEVSFLN